MASKDYKEKYTKPELRERLKEEIKNSDKGGKPGQWSARKAQQLTQAYEREGGGYKGEPDASQRSLAQWTAEDWQTVEGNAAANSDEGMQRYLPKKAWVLLSDQEKREANQTKIHQDDKGNQYADWPASVHRAMTVLGHTQVDPTTLAKAELLNFARRLRVQGRSSMTKAALIDAIQKTEVDSGAEPESDPGEGGLQQKTKRELYTLAQKQGIEGRSRMPKQALIKALQDK